MRLLIVSGGNIDEDFALAFMREQAFDHVIAADKGMEFLRRAGRAPDLIVGDFDSCDQEALEYFRGQGIRIRAYRPEKDYTDTEIAVRLATEKLREGPGDRRITILGATGGRLDHFLGNLKNLSIPLAEGIPCEILDAQNRIRLMDAPFSIGKKEQFGKYVSLLAFAEPVEGLALTGFFYPLSGYTMDSGDAVGVSNQIVEERAQVSFSAGRLLVIESRDRL